MSDPAVNSGLDPIQVYLLRLGVQSQSSAVPAFRQIMSKQRDPVAVECDDPAQADVVLFPDCHLMGRDWRLDGLADMAMAQRWRHKLYVYDERDRPWCRFPGIYVSMPASSFHPGWQVPAAYYTLDTLAPIGVDQPDLLFSFVGSPTASCRRDIYQLVHPRSHVEEVTGFVFYDAGSDRYYERKQSFANILARSMFVLCPRGAGVSSIRLYETLAAGRVPVIIADDWQAPNGPDWADFSIRWPEAHIAELPAYLETRAADFARLSQAAQAAYDRWFAPDVVLSRQFEQLGQLAARSSAADFPVGGFRDAAWRRAGLAAASLTTRRRLGPIKRSALRHLRQLRRV